VGANPRGPLRACSLAVRAFLTSFIDEAGAPPALVVGLSGGADSLALALTTIDVAARAGIPVVTVTVDHGLREGSAEEARRVADLAASLGARAVVETVTVGGPGGPEGAARDARRAALRAVGVREGAPILLGHTMDDQAETVLLRLARGSGPSSLRAIAPISRDGDGVTWLRPLLKLRRTDTQEACAQAGLTPVHDPTNDIDGPWRAADGSPLRRSALRHGAMPALASALGVDPVPALARTAALCAEDDDALIDRARELADAARVAALRVADETDPGGADSPVALAVAPLRGAPRAVRTRALREGAQAAGIRALSSAHVDAIDDLVVAWRGQGPIHLPGGSASRVGHGARARIVFVARERGTPPETDPAQGQQQAATNPTGAARHPLRDHRMLR
jgi:tRNA(Ile)-lysidine synthase